MIDSVVLLDLYYSSDGPTLWQNKTYTPDTDNLPYARVFWVVSNIDRPNDTQIPADFRFKNRYRVLFRVL